MQIFVNKEVKENTKDYWFGVGIPIIGGWGITLFALLILVNLPYADPMPPWQYLLLILMIGGHLIIWPLLAWRLKLRANESENLPYKNGAILSLKLYAIWMIFFILPSAWVEYNFN